MPEIALTPQIVGRFVERFGETVAVLHSRLSAGERHDEWRRLRTGEARVCIGPRSAVFAPIEPLGLIVVDEEHDASYKHEGDPRYDARAVAEERAAGSDAVLLCGSATPRPESLHRLRRLRLEHRVDGRTLPPVEILDMRGAAHGLHPVTAQALADVRRAGGKAIILLNRRGWSNFLDLPRLRAGVGLPGMRRGPRPAPRARLSSPVTIAAIASAAPERCRDCGSLSVARHGAGTERLEHELAAALDDGGFPVLRLDADIAAGRGGAGALLRSFERAKSGVLIGTQMVAKGHDFPDVTLGVVLDADATLRFPDFRAEERTFAPDRSAGRARRARQRWSRAGSDDRSRGRRDRARLPPRQRRLSRGRARAALRSSLSAVHASDPGGVRGGRAGCRPSRRRRPCARASACPKNRCSDRPRCSGCAGASAVRWWSRRTTGCGAIAAVDAAVRVAAASSRHAPVSFSVDVDPQ